MPAPDHLTNVIVLDERCTMLAAERLFRSTQRLRRRYEPTFGPMKVVAQENGSTVLRTEFPPPAQSAKPKRHATLRSFRMTSHSLRFATYGVATLYFGYFAAVVFGLRTAVSH